MAAVEKFTLEIGAVPQPRGPRTDGGLVYLTVWAVKPPSARQIGRNEPRSLARLVFNAREAGDVVHNLVSAVYAGENQTDPPRTLEGALWSVIALAREGGSNGMFLELAQHAQAIMYSKEAAELYTETHARVAAMLKAEADVVPGDSGLFGAPISNVSYDGPRAPETPGIAPFDGPSGEAP
jgi:hypothetical protein